MNIPITGMFAALLSALGIYTLCWYHNLTKAEQEKVDRLACETARQLYGKALNQLTSPQMRQVYDLVRQRFAA